MNRLVLISLAALLCIAAALAGIAVTGELASQAAGIHLLGIVTKVGMYASLTLAFGFAFCLSLLMPGPGRTKAQHSPALTREQHAYRRRGVAYTALYLGFLALSTLSSHISASGAFTLERFGYFIAGTELGTISIVCAAFAALSLTIGLRTRRLRGAGWQGATLALSALTLGFLGHAGSSLDHANAVNAMIIHVLALVTWLGPLAVLALDRHVNARERAIMIQRYSPWAFFALSALAFSGAINALLRLESPAQLVSTGYGLLVSAKIILTIAIAMFGVRQRSLTVREIERTRELPASHHATFLRLAAWEAGLAALIIGASVALTRSQPPVPQYVAPEEYRVLSLVGFEAPHAAFGLRTLVTQWHVDYTFVAVALLLAGLYIAGYKRLRSRGDAWPARRLVMWLLGCLMFILVMNAGPAAYGRIRFDAHMVQHMALMVIIPPLWVLGAPVTLLSRAVEPRNDGSRGIREWVLAILHSRYADVVSSPFVAGFLFAGSLVIFYFTPLFTWAMFEHAGHLIMTVHFLLAGYLFAWVIMGIDPAQRPINPVMKLLTLLATLSFHAFFGIAVVSASWIIGGPWYEALAMFNPAELSLNQVRGGSIMWGISEIPTVFYAITAAVLWRRSEERKARHYDRKAERDGDAELAEYNAYLRSVRGQ